MKNGIAVQQNINSTVSKSRTLNNLVLSVLALCILKMFVCYTFFDINKWISLAITAVTAFLAFISMLTVINKLKFSVQVLWVLLLLFLGVSYLFNHSGLEYIFNTVLFLSILTVLPYTEFNLKTVKVFLILFSFYCLLVALFASKFESSDSGSIDLNTNTSGINLFVFEVCMACLASKSTKGKRAIFYILMLLAVAVQLLFAGRTSLIGTACLFIYLIFKKIFNRMSERGGRNLIILICVLSVVFVYFYSVTLFNAIGNGNIYILGKDIFTGRQKIWSDAFEQIKGHWFFGIGNTLNSMLGEGTNLHNQILGYLVIYGIPVALAYIFLLANVAKKLYNSKTTNFSFAFVLILLVLSYFETYLYSGTVLPIAVAVCILYYFDKSYRLSGLGINK